MLRAILLHPDRLGDPLSLTVNYAGALSTGPFTVQAMPVRTNRSTQHWNVSILQTGAQGEQVVTTTATAVTAVRRETWSLADVAMPEVPTPEQLDAYPAASGIEWFNRYDIRPVTGALPRQWNGQGDSSLSQVWMRDNPARPSIFVRWPRWPMFLPARLAAPRGARSCGHGVDHGVFPCQSGATAGHRHGLCARAGARRSFATAFRPDRAVVE